MVGQLKAAAPYARCHMSLKTPSSVPAIEPGFHFSDTTLRSGARKPQCPRPPIGVILSLMWNDRLGSIATGSSQRRVRLRPLCPESRSEFGALAAAALGLCGLMLSPWA